MLVLRSSHTTIAITSVSENKLDADDPILHCQYLKARNKQLVGTHVKLRWSYIVSSPYEWAKEY